MKKPKSTLGIFVGKIKKTPVTLLASTSCIGEAPYLLLIGFPSSHIYYTFFQFEINFYTSVFSRLYRLLWIITAVRKTQPYRRQRNTPPWSVDKWLLPRGSLFWFTNRKGVRKLPFISPWIGLVGSIHIYRSMQLQLHFLAVQTDLIDVSIGLGCQNGSTDRSIVKWVLA